MVHGTNSDETQSMFVLTILGKCQRNEKKSSQRSVTVLQKWQIIKKRELN